SLATAYNQSRNLALDPVTGCLHLVYESGDSIYYSYSDDGGEHWAPVECIAAEAAFPTVVCENQRVWVSYLRPVYHTIVCKTRLGAGGSTGAWDDYFVHPIDPQAEPGPPAMSREYVAPVDFDGIYVAYALDYGSSTTVEFRHVRHQGGVTDSYTLDGPSVLYSCGTPSVATTPGDIVHFAWWRHEADPTLRDRIVYRHRTPDGEWTEPTEVSNPALPPGCEPAFYPFVDACGDRLTAVWESQWQQQGEVWSRQKLVSESRFQEPAHNKSSTLAPSRYPQNSTSDVIVWQELVEPDNEDIWADVVGVPWPVKIWQDQFRSVYPDIFTVLPEPGAPDPTVINAVWTNASNVSPDFFQVMFRRCETSADATADYPYYDCGVGNPVQSAYCLARDGWAKWREFNVDYGRDRLRYRLPFLNPNCIYRLRAVLFHPARDTWTQTFSFEGRSGRSFSYRGLEPETIWLTIPPELYREGCAVTFDVIRQAGEFATVAELVLFQCYPFRRSSPDEDEAMSGFAAATLPVRFCAVGPTPFRGRTRISYSVAHERDVNLGIYDVQGRQVRALASGPHAPGVHAAAWDGTDNQGRKLPAGAYFCRMESSGIARSQRVIMLR
ncbi:MAG: FlgD immunoglobulin-like domain containing protein, partial [candidate division WOR-3 bacterium]